MEAKITALKKKNDFNGLFEKGKGFKEDFLYLKIKKNNLRNSRFGFVISNKVSKKAVVRNKIKRRMRAIVDIKMPNIKKGFDIAIVVRPGFQINDFWELEEKIDKLFKKAGII